MFRTPAPAITLEFLRRWNACAYTSRVAYFAGRESITPSEVASDETLLVGDRLWVLTRLLIDVRGLDELAAYANDRSPTICTDRAYATADRDAADATKAVLFRAGSDGSVAYNDPYHRTYAAANPARDARDAYHAAYNSSSRESLADLVRRINATLTKVP